MDDRPSDDMTRPARAALRSLAHEVGAMVVQADAARAVLRRRPDEADAALLAIASTGRAALFEIRRRLIELEPTPCRGGS